jgi:hypothetical protein
MKKNCTSFFILTHNTNSENSQNPDKGFEMTINESKIVFDLMKREYVLKILKNFSAKGESSRWSIVRIFHNNHFEMLPHFARQTLSWLFMIFPVWFVAFLKTLRRVTNSWRLAWRLLFTHLFGEFCEWLGGYCLWLRELSKQNIHFWDVVMRRNWKWTKRLTNEMFFVWFW